MCSSSSIGSFFYASLRVSIMSFSILRSTMVSSKSLHAYSINILFKVISLRSHVQIFVSSKSLKFSTRSAVAIIYFVSPGCY